MGDSGAPRATLGAFKLEVPPSATLGEFKLERAVAERDGRGFCCAATRDAYQRCAALTRMMSFCRQEQMTCAAA